MARPARGRRRRRRGRCGERLRALVALAVLAGTAALVLPFWGGGRSIDESIDYWSARYGVDPRLAHAVAWTESRKDPSAVSSAGALGVMQVQPATWAHTERLLGERVAPTTDGNIRIGIAYLRRMLDEFGDTRAALAAYNQGPTALRRHGPYRSAASYAETVLALARAPHVPGT
jgi:soluble lytic murein transglycosylase-like protein